MGDLQRCQVGSAVASLRAEAHRSREDGGPSVASDLRPTLPVNQDVGSNPIVTIGFLASAFGAGPVRDGGGDLISNCSDTIGIMSGSGRGSALAVRIAIDRVGRVEACWTGAGGSSTGALTVRTGAGAGAVGA